MYMGLSFPTPLDGSPSRFGVACSDEYGWAQAREIDPDVVVASQEYDDILKGLYWEKVTGDPVGAVILYAKKAWYVLWYFSPILVFIAGGLAVALRRAGSHRRGVVAAIAFAIPTLTPGLDPSILEIGSATLRASVWQYVSFSVLRLYLKQHT